MNMLRRLGLALALATVLFGGFQLPSAYSQVPSNPAPYNIDVGAILTNTLRVAGTATSSDQANTNWRGLVCTFETTLSSGSTSTVWGIQEYDAATDSWLTLLSSDAYLASMSSETANGTPFKLALYPGMQTATLPSNMKALSYHLPRTWRVTQTVSNSVGNSNGAITGKIGCNYLI